MYIYIYYIYFTWVCLKNLGIHENYIYILVGGIPTPLKNMSSSVGVMTFPIYGKINKVPNHQPERERDIYIYWSITSFSDTPKFWLVIVIYIYPIIFLPLMVSFVCWKTKGLTLITLLNFLKQFQWATQSCQRWQYRLIAWSRCPWWLC